MTERLQADLLILGGGLAGLTVALHAQAACTSVILVEKGRLFHSGSTFVNRNGRWGMTFAGTDEERERLFTAINRLSKGTNVPGLTSTVVAEGERAYRQLRSWGIRFVPGTDGRPGRYPPCFLAEPLARLVTSTGQVAEQFKRLLDRRRVTILEESRGLRLELGSNDCRGALVEDGFGNQRLLLAKATVVATGGDRGCWPVSIAGPGLTGDGYNMLHEAGLPLMNREYVQRVWEDYRPTRTPRFAFQQLCEDGVILSDYQGKRIDLDQERELFGASRLRHVPIANLQPDRDLDEVLLRHIPAPVPEYAVRVHGHDGVELFHLLPHQQACNGGVVTGDSGQTSIARLYAVGEVATGMHGGDRVGGMMISSALVFGRRAARHFIRAWL